MRMIPHREAKGDIAVEAEDEVEAADEDRIKMVKK